MHPENVHLTLKHLGALDEAILEPLQERMNLLVEPLFPFQVECTGVGADPTPQHARRIWAMLDKGSGDVLDLLRRALEKELGQLGFGADERPFWPGLLLGRPQRASDPALLGELELHAQRRFGASTIKDMVLFAASQDQERTRYRVVNRFELGKTQ